MPTGCVLHRAQPFAHGASRGGGVAVHASHAYCDDIRQQVERFMHEAHGPSHDDPGKDEEAAKAAAEQREPSVSQAGGFKNDPDDPSNPNEVIERTRRKLRP